MYYKNAFHENESNSRKTWGIINELTWRKSNNSHISEIKQNGISISNSQDLSINGAPIKQVPVSKSLGVHIDENLFWTVHVETISKKIASGIDALKRIRYFVPRKTLQFIFNWLIQPHFEYCSAVWGNCNKILADKFIQKLQNRSARVLTFSSYDTNADRSSRNLAG